MPRIQDQAYIYHITRLENMASILARGLLPRRGLRGFADVADPEILDGRAAQNLDTCVPFHFFAGNPFDGRVHEDYPDSDFVLIAVSRELARERGWRVIPIHPLAREGARVYQYDEGFNAIDWEAMNRRDYRDPFSKRVCMAECLSPEPVLIADVSAFYVSNERVQQQVNMLMRDACISKWVNVNRGMFRR
ncbi:DarT ssDNA thymidine ADP-ribosyltransferase family protein [Shewanella algae]|uniref:DarT ssDNA thymidine ADP-ribosyltransferase family protein n=1 Tax=Shewanella algae TaxID=38313 RepID=UPI00313ADD8B